ncbi:hypothetical protein [Niveibacterium sp. COAC-50]|uniref:hypothetical protein n=1 Tax=Niveibacterium sp. COAC-50 TaxID=2729384 RepID=UPI001554DCC1|nr:hypothetical protein [Niveibacterium sp. COAC-50]
MTHPGRYRCLFCSDHLSPRIATVGPRQSLAMWTQSAWQCQIDRLIELASTGEPIGVLALLMVTLAREAVFEGQTLILEPEQAERFDAADAVEHLVNDDLIIVCKPEDRAAVTTAVLEIARCAGYTGCATNLPPPPT